MFIKKMNGNTSSERKKMKNSSASGRRKGETERTKRTGEMSRERKKKMQRSTGEQEKTRRKKKRRGTLWTLEPRGRAIRPGRAHQAPWLSLACFHPCVYVPWIVSSIGCHTRGSGRSVTVHVMLNICRIRVQFDCGCTWVVLGSRIESKSNSVSQGTINTRPPCCNREDRGIARMPVYLLLYEEERS